MTVEETYERRLDLLTKKWDDRLQRLAAGHTRRYLDDPRGDEGFCTDNVHDALAEVLFHSAEWSGVAATDISDIAMEYADRAYHESKTEEDT